MKLTKLDLIPLSFLICWCSLDSEALSVTERVQNATSQSCRIPDGNVKFTQTECGEPGGCADSERASHGSVYSLTCLGNRTFARTNETNLQIKCINGEWTPSLDEYTCIELCPKLDYKSLDLQCYYSSNSVPCNQTLVPGTAVYASCKINYEVKTIVNYVNRTTCQKDGSYHPELTECTPVCGKTATSNAQALISKGTKVNYPKYPWHIALYWKNYVYNGSFEYEYKCGGTLIDSNKVLTAAHCIWDPTSGKLIEAKILEVASGKIYSRWDALDGSAQKVGVADVIPAAGFKGVATRYEQDIAVLILSEHLEISDFTMPVCLDLDLSAGGVPLGQRGHIVGWGREDEDSSPSEYLMETWMEYMDVNSCHIKFRKHSFQEYLLSDKFCVLYVNGSGTQQGDSGGGLTFLHDELHYVYGVVSIKKLGQNEFAAVTNVTTHRHWLQDILATNGLGRGCIIPQGGEIFHLMKCGDLRGCKKKYWAPLNSAYRVTCADEYGWSTPNQKSTSIFCYQGEWIPNESQWKCKAFCPRVVEHESLNIGCTYRGVSVSCNQPMMADTTVSVTCKKQYKVAQGDKANFVSETRCGSEGRLLQELKICEPACGRSSYVQSLEADGHDEITKYPWHVLIYWKKRNNTEDEDPQDNSEYDYKCGGSLVDSNKVLTAAHCVWDMKGKGTLSADMLAVASGKTHLMWDFQEITEQKVNVSKVIPNVYYSGHSTRYSEDIAVLILSRDLELSQHTMPVCLDLDLSAGGVPSKKPGQVLVWDQQVDEGLGPNTTLKDIWMEYLDLKSCREKFSDNDFISYLLYDKFCILYINGTGPQVRDSGSGIIFKHGDFHFVYGIVSLKKKDENVFAVATNVTSHRSWLMDVMTTN